ncbi:MAG: helix-turn-helix domain-containing protein [Verrucomicrobiaceae bacterium]|nr:helix-turn-helix domain-containing protein [Verrucomicrobiaceae bacterium]
MKTNTHPLTGHSTSTLLTKKQAANYLGIAPRTLDDWRKGKAVACIKRPGFVRFLRSDLDDFIARHRTGVRTVPNYRPRVHHLTKMTRLPNQPLSNEEQNQISDQ